MSVRSEDANKSRRHHNLLGVDLQKIYEAIEDVRHAGQVLAFLDEKFNMLGFAQSLIVLRISAAHRPETWLANNS
jgi:hypothetical protein